MAADADKRKLTLVDAFNVAATSLDSAVTQQLGYQKVDDKTVVERKLIPILACASSKDTAIVRVDVYDFNNFTVSSYAMRVGDDENHLSASTRDFSQVEGKQSIRDAHRALVELDGCPPPIDEIMGYIMELRKDVSIAAPIKLKTPQN